MADYSLRNLQDDVENMAVQFGMAPDVEAHFARGALDCVQTGVSLLRLAPNARMPFGHRHERQEEIYVVLEGSGRVKLDDEMRELRPLDGVRIGKDTIRCVEAGPDGIAYIAFGAPTAETPDVEMLPGWWSE